jgi:hypothetical protein
VLPKRSPHQQRLPHTKRVPETPAFVHGICSGGVLVLVN